MSAGQDEGRVSAAKQATRPGNGHLTGAVAHDGSAPVQFHPLADIFPMLDAGELQALADDIRANGLREPIVLYEGAVLDGRNRYAACVAAGVAPRFETYAGTDPLGYVLSLNLHRRHLNESQRAMVAARIAGLPAHRPNASASIDALTQPAAAAAVNVSRPSVQRARVVLDHGTPELVRAVDSGAIPVSRAATVARLAPDEQRAAVARDADAPHVSRNTGNSEWYTPRDYIAAAVRVMGAIDLDPATTRQANEVVGAARIFTVAENGLAHPWRGRVWMNPPYSADLVKAFAAKLVGHVLSGEVSEACVLVNNATETTWFYAMADRASAVCFPRGRVRFWGPDNEVAAPLQGQAVLYIGRNVDAFRAAFSDFGWTACLTR